MVGAVIGPVGVAVVAAVLVVAWQMAEDRGLRIPILGPLAEATERCVAALVGLIVPLCVFGVAFLILEPAGVPIAVPAGLAAAAFVGAGVFRRWRDRHGDVDRALVGFRPRRGVSARRIDALHEEGWRLLAERRYTDAAAVYREAAELGDVDAMVNLANILTDELDLSDEGERWYRRAIELGSTTAAENLALQRLDEDRVEEARELFELARRGGDSAGYLGLARIAFEQGELERARGLLEIAILEGDLDAYGPLGDVLVGMNRDQEAEQRLREGLAAGAKGAAAVLAQLLRTAGRDDEADALLGCEHAEPWPPE